MFICFYLAVVELALRVWSVRPPVCLFRSGS